MSDPMMGGGPPPQGPPPGGMGSNPIEENRSVLNPTDLAAMSQNGDIRPDMSVGDFIQNVLKVPLDAPLPQLVSALKKQGQNATAMGKVQSMGGPPQGQPPSGPPPGGPPPGGPPSGGGGIDSLMQGMGGR